MTDHESAPRPSERFSGAAGVLDLDAVAADLLGATDADRHGRAQRTLYRFGGVSIAMFAFRAGASLPTHSTESVVSIHVLRGQVSMHAGSSRFELTAGQVLRLEPRTPHDLEAVAPSVILVHIAAIP